VATLGPSTAGVDRLTALLEAGVDVVRLNMSHGDHASHAANLADVRAAAERTGRVVTTVIDLQGPKIRLGRFAGGPVALAPGDRFTITTRDVPGDATACSTTYAGLPGDVGPGDRILIDDGRVGLQVVSTSATDVDCTVVVGGTVSDHKGINLPGVPVSVPALTDKDAADLRWGLAQGIDMVALSFVRSPADAAAVRAVMDEVGIHVPVIAKIEKPQALEDLEAVVTAFDALMVARGDLGVELPFEEVPLAQKRIIHAARTRAKPVIVATQMLESMITASRPTRAEASDVANAILDGADAVMLSGETAVGAYPVDAVTAMARIIESVEAHGHRWIDQIDWHPHTTSGAIAWAAATVAERLGASYIVGFSLNGDTARRLARLRTATPTLCFTPNDRTRRELGLVWGMTTFLSANREVDAMIAEMDDRLIAEGLVARGDTLVLVYGTPLGVAGKTNTMYVHRVLETD